MKGWWSGGGYDRDYQMMMKESSAPLSSWRAMLLSAATLATSVDGMGVGVGPFMTYDVSSSATHIHRRVNSVAFVAPTVVSPIILGHQACRRRRENKPLYHCSAFYQRRSSENGYVIPTSLCATSCAHNNDVSNILLDKDSLSYSEEDVIRILRASPRYNGNISRKACHTALDVVYLMSQYTHNLQVYKEISTPHDIAKSVSTEDLHSIIEPVMNGVSPNIAAAALRRLSSPPFLPLSFAHNKYSRRKRHMKNEIVSTKEEQNVYEQLIHLLLKKLSDTMENQLNAWTTNGPCELNASPALLPHRDTLKTPPDDGKKFDVLNWYALADLQYSLSNLANNLRGTKEDSNAQSNISSTDQGLIINLYHDVVQYVSWDNTITSSFVRCIGPRRLIRDVFQPIAIMNMIQQKMQSWGSGTEEWRYTDNEEGVDLSDEELGRDCTQLLGVLSSYIVLPHSLEKLTASDLSMVMWYMTKLYSPYNNQESAVMQQPQRILLRIFMKRLRKYPVRSSANGSELAQVVWSVAQLINQLEKQDEASLLIDNFPVEPTIPLSIRLPGEDEGVTSGEDTTHENVNPKDGAEDIISTSTLKEEAVTMYHTLLNEVVLPPFYSRDKKSGVDETSDTIKLHSLSLRHIGDILSAATSLSIGHDDIAVAVTKMLQYMVSNPSSSQNPLNLCRSCKDISRLLLSLQRLRVGTGLYDGIAAGERDINQRIESRCVQLLGERFLHIVRWHKRQAKLLPDPKTLAITLRSGVLMYQGNSMATKAILDAATTLILDETYNDEHEEEDDDTVSFLSACNEFEVSNYLFAYAMARQLKVGVFIALTDQMTDDGIIGTCTPSSASRAMWSCATLLSLEDSDNLASDYYETSYLHERQIDLFHQLSPLLLSSSLSPTDISGAMWAIAKIEYMVDKGIFDELACLMASNKILQLSNTRLVSQALWSCGRMVSFEDLTQPPMLTDDQDTEFDFDEDSDSNVPYIESAEKFIRFLIANQKQMTPKHIAQSAWAMGKLQMSNRPFLVEDMADVASRSCDLMNAREVANICWGLNKAGYDNTKVICKLVHHLTRSHKFKDCTAQEASMIMLVLGKLRIRDEDAFKTLSNILRDRLDEATSQSITNTLWAFDNVGLPPPPQLLMSWAKDTLNLAVVSDDRVTTKN